ncbi:MAG TPA: PRC-barrel domain-containing protein, partial [Coleofasciculaceae cyanobacterium]
MALLRLKDFEASSRRSLRDSRGYNLVHFEVYTAQEEKVGQVADILIDEVGHCQHIIIALSEEIANKQVLLPYEQCQVDQTTQHICVEGLNREQIANLKTYNPI